MDGQKARGYGESSESRHVATGIVIAALITLAITVLFWSVIGAIVSIPIKMLTMFAVQVSLFGVACIMSGAYEGGTFGRLGFTRKDIGRQLLWAAILLIILAALFIFVPGLMGWDVVNRGDSLLFVAAYQLLFVGFAEETLFRGYFLPAFVTITRSRVLGIILSSILFGLWHAVGPLVSGQGWPLLQMCVTAILGAILAAARIYVKDCSMLSVSLAHGAYNTLLRLLGVFF